MKSPVSHLLETSSQITWKISLEVNIINHISYPFLKSMFIEKWSNSTYCWRQQEGLLDTQPLILNLLCLLGLVRRHFLQNFMSEFKRVCVKIIFSFSWEEKYRCQGILILTFNLILEATRLKLVIQSYIITTHFISIFGLIMKELYATNLEHSKVTDKVSCGKRPVTDAEHCYFWSPSFLALITRLVLTPKLGKTRTVQSESLWRQKH